MTGLRLEALISARAAQNPAKAAIIYDDTSITFRKLETQSNRLASMLTAIGVMPGDRLCLLLPKSIDAIVCMLATLKVGGIYVPMDLASPAQRSQKILDACEPSVLFVSAESRKVLSALKLPAGKPLRMIATSSAPESVGRFEISYFFADLDRFSPAFETCKRPDTDPAHILFTSGSTGTPKGVVITHRNVNSFLNWVIDYFGYSSNDKMSGHPPLHFDLSTMDIFGSLSAGATLYPVPARLSLVAPALTKWIQEKELTQWFSVPSILTYMAKFDAMRDVQLPHLKRLIWCGEVLPTPTLMYWMERLPHVEFTNLYGPTEATIASSYYTLDSCPTDEKLNIPIGRPCKGESLLVLANDLQSVADGEIGDIYISGEGLSPGYWRDKEKTNAVFLNVEKTAVPHQRIYKTGDLGWRDKDGLFHYSGRADSQIKSRGYRIELGEIETALHSLTYITEAAVVGVDAEGFEGKTICCAYSSRALPPESHARLRKDLAKIVPNYMLPSRWHRLEILPKNANGKIDRPRLRNIFNKGSEPSENAAETREI
ncbi:amino acid adenylation domain-containing protein [Pseudomonadota bacterium]